MQLTKLQEQLHGVQAAADAASHLAAQRTSSEAALQQQLHAQASDANDLLSVMNGMRETLSQQQRAISKLVAKRARADERAAAAEERSREAEARAELLSQQARDLQTQLEDAAICVQLHQAVAERVSAETSSIQAAYEQKINELKECLSSKLQEVEKEATVTQENARGALEAVHAAHALQQKQMQSTHDSSLKVLQASLEDAQQRNAQLREDLVHAQADSMDLLQKCDAMRQSMSEDAASFREKLCLAAAAAAQSHSQMVAAQQAHAMAVAGLDEQNKQLLSQIQELNCALASRGAELEEQQQLTADAACSTRAASIAQHIAESELQLEREATLLHRSRADSAEKLLQESARMRADIQVVLAAASDELADALQILRSDDCDASVAYLACSAVLGMLRHTRPVFVDSSRLDTAIAALEDICATTASHAGKKIAAMAVAAADAMRDAEELRSRCSEQQLQLQQYISQSLEATGFREQLQQMHMRIDSMTQSLEEEHAQHEVLVKENEKMELLCSKAAAETACAQQQRDEHSVELQRMQQALQDLQAQLDVSLQEAATAAATNVELQAQRDALIAESSRLAADVEQWRVAAQTAMCRLEEVEAAARMQLDTVQQSAAIEINSLKSAVAEANGRVADVCNRLSELQLDASEEKRRAIEDKDSASTAAAQMEADHAQLLRDCELLHAYQSETLQELKQLQSMYDQLLSERDEIEEAAAAHAEEQEKRLQEVSEAAAAAESERVQLLQHLHLSQQENLQLHRQQQADEREKISLQSAATMLHESAQKEAAAKLRELQVMHRTSQTLFQAPYADTCLLCFETN
jgi:hypothetical protein